MAWRSVASPRRPTCRGSWPWQLSSTTCLHTASWPILGAFLAGTAFAAVFRNRGDLDRKLTGFGYGFLIPVFFINVGISFELEGVADVGALLFTGLLLVAALAVKVIPSLLLLLRRHSLREAVAAGALLSARLSLIIVVAELGVELGLLDRTLQAQIILLAVATASKMICA